MKGAVLIEKRSRNKSHTELNTPVYAGRYNALLAYDGYSDYSISNNPVSTARYAGDIRKLPQRLRKGSRHG